MFNNVWFGFAGMVLITAGFIGSNFFRNPFSSIKNTTLVTYALRLQVLIGAVFSFIYLVKGLPGTVNELMRYQSNNGWAVKSVFFFGICVSVWLWAFAVWTSIKFITENKGNQIFNVITIILGLVVTLLMIFIIFNAGKGLLQQPINYTWQSKFMMIYGILGGLRVWLKTKKILVNFFQLHENLIILKVLGVSIGVALTYLAVLVLYIAARGCFA